MRRQRSAVPNGWKKGHEIGWKHGYHVGTCESIKQRLPDPASEIRSIRVLYVRAGLSGPFPEMDQAIIEVLRGMVSELIIASPTDNLVELAGWKWPDLVLTMHGIRVPASQIQGIRAIGIKTAIWLVDEPYVTDVTTVLAPQYEYLFTHELATIPIYEQLGCQVHYLPLAVNPKLYKPKYVPPQYQSDICFIGNAFHNRVNLIDRIHSVLETRDTRIVGLFWKRLRHYRKLRKGIQIAWISSEKASNYYNGAKIVINIHRAYDDKAHNKNSLNIPGLSINPRTYEILASGAFQLTDIRQDLTDFYVPGVDLETYSSPKELVDKIIYYLHDEQKRMQIARNGFMKTIEKHTYQNRLSQLLQIIFPLMNSGT
ncbi:CgeB family protein [Paenibacillus arenilitoris]|uniref:Glycosyltransferase n=1 Tax=Paenibacillus arenilitoris TaxID=2772299 RepID=A0A927CTD8_9BACL|nr:glycosyltransferase [Paenibacillus arenilitoris]MBD2871526.1 glycosyltransferase [Paenibacillus arenilitoris]